jgi:fumarate reductase flavoprotein subunit
MPGADRREGADLIVVGASVGGMTAAVTAADRGCQVIILERTKELGGGAAAGDEAIAASGSRWQRDAGIDDSPEGFAADLLKAGVATEHEGLVRALAGQSTPLVEWLADRCGATLRLVPSADDAPPPARLHACAEHGGSSLVAALARVVGRHHRIKARLGTEATGLLRDEAGVTGVTVKPDRRGGPTVTGRVLLACGGFAGSDELIAEHCAGAAGLPVGGPALATGDGLRFALAAGARATGLEQCAVSALFALPAQLAVPAALLRLGGVLVNQAGERFTTDAADTLSLAQEVRAQPGHVAYLVFDDRVADATSADPFVEHVILPRAARRGMTVADLAKQLELDTDGLASTTTGTGLQPPLRAIRVTGARLRTLGGVGVDAHARVLDAHGQPIAGLYATGGVTEALAAASWLAPLAALGLGRLAALHVIAAVSAEAEA